MALRDQAPLPPLAASRIRPAGPVDPRSPGAPGIERAGIRARSIRSCLMLSFLRILGIVIGISAAALVLSRVGGRQNPIAPTGPMISECDGAIREIVIQYVHGAESVLPVYQDFFPQLSPETIVNVACPDRAAFD